MGKGSKQRTTDPQKFGANYDAIFGKSALRQMDEYTKSIDPMSGPNVLRHSSIVDNVDGTLTFKRSAPYVTGSIAMPTCATCKHWERYEPASKNTLAAQDPDWEKNGVCSGVDRFIDDCGCGGGFHPPETFYCGKWEAK